MITISFVKEGESLYGELSALFSKKQCYRK